MKNEELDSLWENVLGKLRETINEATCQRWFGPIRPLALTDTSLRLGAPSLFYKNYIEARYIPFIKDAILSAVGQKLLVEIENLELEDANDASLTATDPAIPEGPSRIAEKNEMVSYGSAASKKEAEEKASQSFLSPMRPGDHSSLNPKHTFDTFVTGSSNQMAQASALAVAESPGKIYNPLFIYGGVGLGKTHLMHAIGNYVLDADPSKRVLYISSEKFVNEFIDTLREGKPEAFRQKYRQVDVLLVDDLQFLSEKERTQEEFFHTFNALYDAGKAIILSSDRPPNEIRTLEDRLRSRFKGGLMTDIHPPNLETRIAILQKKALLDNLDVPNEVMYFIASRIDTNIRELEGALTRVAAYASLKNEKITPELAADAMKDVYEMKKKNITVELIQETICSYYKLPLQEMLSQKRTREIAFPRQVAMYLCRTLTSKSLEQIATAFNRNDHTTVLHAEKRITKQRGEDANLDRTIQELLDRLQKL